jgi:hypothetical protein
MKRPVEYEIRMYVICENGRNYNIFKIMGSYLTSHLHLKINWVKFKESSS